MTVGPEVALYGMPIRLCRQGVGGVGRASTVPSAPAKPGGQRSTGVSTAKARKERRCPAELHEWASKLVRTWSG